MQQRSQIAQLLGWPGPCETGLLNVTVITPDGKTSNQHIEAKTGRRVISNKCWECGSTEHSTYEHRIKRHE